MRIVRMALLIALGAGPALPVHAQPSHPVILAIAFAGNEVTREVTMRREIVIREGEPADPERIERSRQAILDLGLFRDVRADVLPDIGGVVVLFTVTEKWYVLPIPRIEANADEEYGLGMQLRWANVWGLNHSLRAVYVRRQLAERERSTETLYGMVYDAPFVFDTPLSFGAAIQQSDAPVFRDGLSYEERDRRIAAGLARKLGDGPASQGRRVGAGLEWLHHETFGPQAPPGQGDATALGGFVGYRDVRFHVYSETGSAWGATLSVASPALLSDYGLVRATAGWWRSWQVGSRPHQTIAALAQVGARWQGRTDVEEFSVGGSSVLRGFEPDARSGNLFWRVGFEALRPVAWDWLRALLILEAGNALPEPSDATLRDAMFSVGIGLRLRVTWFVNLELEVGIARGFGEGGRWRVFGGGV